VTRLAKHQILSGAADKVAGSTASRTRPCHDQVVGYLPDLGFDLEPHVADSKPLHVVVQPLQTPLLCHQGHIICNVC